jgi:hypothetical protein
LVDKTSPEDVSPIVAVTTANPDNITHDFRMLRATELAPYNRRYDDWLAKGGDPFYEPQCTISLEEQMMSKGQREKYRKQHRNEHTIEL